VRVLTVRQPWAHAVVHLGKDVENRTRNIAGAYRGPVAIHAGKRELPVDDPSRLDILGVTGQYPLLTLTSGLGVVIGVVDLVDVHHATGCPEHRDGAPWPLCSLWAMRDHHHLVLANPRALATPIPARGRLGLWTPDPDLEHAITTALATTAEVTASA
jgi:hypothetical protein